MTKRLMLVPVAVVLVIFFAGTIWGARVDPRKTVLPPSLPRGDESPDYLITRAPGVLWEAFCGEDTIISPYDTVIGCTYYEWQAACRMPRMIANDYQDITSGGHGLHFTFMYQDSWGVNAKRYVNYTYWDADNGWDSLPAPMITLPGSRAGYTGLDIFRPLDGYFKPHSRAVICYHAIEPVSPNYDDMGTVISIEPNTPGAIEMEGGGYWYDIPDSADFERFLGKGMWAECAVDSLNRIHIVMQEGKTSAGFGWMGYVRCEERAADKLMCWAPGKDSVILDKETQYFDPHNVVVVFDKSGVESHSVVTSKVSNKVAVFWPALAQSETDSSLYQIANDIYYFESTNGGDDWFAAGSLPQRINITKYRPEDKMRVYGSVSAVYDMNDSLHIFWHTHYYDQDLQEIDIHNVSLWHWSKATERMCDGETLVANQIAHAQWEANAGAWNRLLDKMQAGVGYDPGLDSYNYLYLQWIQFDSNKTSQSGMTQGDIYMSVSTDGGLVWQDPVNVTNSTVPSCTTGGCASDHWPSMAERVDTAIYMQWIYDLDAGGMVQDEGGPTNNPVLFYHLPVSSIPIIDIVRMDWSPKHFVHPYIHLSLNQIDTVYLTIENMGTQTLNISSISSDASWLSNNPTSATIPAGDCPANVELIITGGSEETFLVDSIRIQSNDQVGNNDIYVRMHVVVSDVYMEPEFAVVSNPNYHISESNVGNLGHQNDTAGFFLHQDVNEPHFLNDGSPVLAFTSPDGDSLVGRYIFDEHYFLPETELSVDTFPHLKTILVEAKFSPVTPQAPLPWHHQWWWWTIRMKDYIFYSGASNDNKEQYVALKVYQLYYNPPPEWWPLQDPLPSVPETYLGMALDIDCPSDSDAWNYPFVDSTRRMVYLQGYGGPNMNYRMAIAQKDTCYTYYHGGFPETCCWPDPNVIEQPDQPYAMHILRNDAFTYPQGGYVDDSLYKYMSMPGYSIYGTGNEADYNIVTTGRVIPAQSFPPADTYSVAYALAVSDRYDVAHLDSLVDMVMCGNYNRDNTVNVVDIVYLINYLFRSGPEPWLYMGDCNADGEISISDAVCMVHYVLKSGERPKCASL